MKFFETPLKVVPESPKNPDSSAKASKDVSKTSPAKDFRENGTRVSMNGKEGDLEDGVVGTQKILVERDFEGEDTVDLGDNEGGGVLEDSEMNGASSLLKMQESKSLRGLDSVLDVIDKSEKRDFKSGDGISLVADICGDFHSSSVRETRQFDREEYPDGMIGESSDSKDREGEDNMGDGEGHEFVVGDFVWGKIKSHPWWPGRVYDPLDASEYAKKVKQKDKILVAYFGDGTFAWCNPSQLKPLDKNFVEMSKQSSSKNFFNAVEKAMDEVGRLVDLKMTCSCVPQENLIGFGRTLAVNAGTKEGLLVPEGGIDKFLTALFEPAEFLAALKCTAQFATITNMLEFTVLKSSLSAFYRAKGGYQLPSYYEPKPIPGLEDDTRNWMADTSDYSNGVEVRLQGPVEEDWLSSPTGFKYGQTTQSMLHKCQGVSGGAHYLRRKQKSLAEIMDGNADAEAEKKDDDLAGGGAKSTKEASFLSKRKKRKCMGEDINPEGKSEVMDATREGSNLGKPASSSGRKKRKVSDEADGECEPSSGGKKRKTSDETDVNNSGSRDLFSKPRARKDMKVSESLVAADNKVSSLEADDSKVKKESMKNPLPRGRKRKASSNVEDGDGGKNEEMKEKALSVENKVDRSPNVLDSNAKAKEQIKEGSLPRERKRSKYLSLPYTDLNNMQRKQVIEAESLKITSEARLGERLTKAAGFLIGSSPTLKFSSDRFEKKPSKEPDAEHETSDNSVPQTPKQDQINIDPTIVKVPANEVLSKIKFAALNPQYLKEADSLDMVGKFFSAFRSSICCNGYYEVNDECLPGRKRKFQKSEPGPLEKEQNQTDHSSPDSQSQRTKSKKREEAKLDKPKVKQAASLPDMKTKDKESNVEAPGAALYVTFGPGSPLPSKNDLIKIYGKFGALNVDETEMLYTNDCAKVVFLKSSEAEEAFNDSQLSSPFKSANATFRLRYISAETKTRELGDISSSKPSSLGRKGTKTPEMPCVSQSFNSYPSQLGYIKQKLEMITSMVQMSDGKISPDMKSSLEGEMKVLLEKVSTMVSSSS